MLSQYPRSAFQAFCGDHQKGSAAVRAPNPPRPFARYRRSVKTLRLENSTTPIPPAPKCKENTKAKGIILFLFSLPPGVGDLLCMCVYIFSGLRGFVRSEQIQNARIFRIFVPNFAPNFAPDFARIFEDFAVLCFFLGSWRPQTIHQISLPFFNAKSPGKFEEKIHKRFRESRQSKVLYFLPLPRN